jgi:hypothetical protein
MQAVGEVNRPSYFAHLDPVENAAIRAMDEKTALNQDELRKEYSMAYDVL